MTFRNVERTGTRRITRFSEAVRLLEKVTRNQDIDSMDGNPLFGYCPKCGKPYYFAEVKATYEKERYWTNIGNLAHSQGCYGLLVVEDLDEPDDGEVFDIKRVWWEDGKKKLSSQTGLSYSDITTLQLELLDKHTCDSTYNAAGCLNG